MVYIAEAENDETIPVPVDKENFIPLQILERFFPGAAGLMYFQDGKKLPVAFDRTLSKLIPPKEGWGENVFYVVRPSSRTTTETHSKRKSKHSAHEYLEKVLPYLYRFKKNEGSNTELYGSATAISKNLIATCAHVLFGLDQYIKIAPNTVLPPNETYFYATNNEQKTFKLLLISLTVWNDLAILKVVGNELLVTEEPLISMPLRCAFHYMIIGYSKFDGFLSNKELPSKRDEGIKSAWSIVEGIITHHADNGCYEGHGEAAPVMAGGSVLGNRKLGPNYDDFAGCPAIDLDNFGPVLFGICRGVPKGHNTGTLPIVHIIPMSILLSKVAEYNFNESVLGEQFNESGSPDSEGQV